MLSSAIAVSLARKGRAVATQHFLEPDHAARTGPKALIYSAAHRWVSGRLSGYIAISEAVRTAMLTRREAPPDRIHVVQNGVPPIDPTLLAAPKDVRQALNVPEDHLLILCAARLEKEKDIGTLLAALSKVNMAHSKVTCLIAGAGSLENELSATIERHSFQNTVRLLGFRNDILSLIGACDLFVLPSLAEPFGLVLLQAMALRKPVIATNAGGPREIVVDGGTGLLTPPGDSSAMALAISAFVDDRKSIIMMGDQGYDRFQERFTAKRMSQQMLAIYNGVINSTSTNSQVG